jgi:uncharacterized delta-60 repeat protein
LQPDGKVLIGGDFYFNGTNLSSIARLNANGSVDRSFDPGTGADDGVSSVTLQPDGRVLIGSYFGIGRLNANGSVDSSFNPGVIGGSVDPDYPNVVSSVLVQPDGKVLIGGYFSTVDGANCSGIARLNADGGLDGSLNPGASIDGRVGALVVQPDGKVLIGGFFTEVNGTNRNNIARLNANGSLDSAFNPGAGAGAIVRSIALQPDGKVLIGGAFFVNGTYRGIARLNANGSLDNSFQPDLAAFIHPEDCGNYGSCFQWTEATAVLVQADGKVLIGGYTVSERQIDPDGDIEFFYRSFLARFNANGSLDGSFEPALGDQSYSEVQTIRGLAVQPDGKVLVGGTFYSIKGTNRYGIARLNANGTLDSSFNLGTGAFGVTSIKLQPDGKVLIGGPYWMLRDTNYPNYHAMARLDTDGSLDRTFNPAIGANDDVQSLAIQPDGKVFVTGYITVNGTTCGIARLNPAGGLDSSFNPGTGWDAEVLSIALQSDGKVLIGGDFTIVNGALRPRVARLYGDSFAPPSLNIARTNAFAIVSWPVTGLNFQLQESTNLFPAAWSPVAQPAVTNAGQISVTVPSTVERKFFRLKSQ